MSVRAMGWALERNVRPGAKLVLVALANFADAQGFCYPSQSTLARLTGQTERTVRTHLAALEDADLIARPFENKRANGGLYRADTFRLQMSKTERGTEPTRRDRRRASKSSTLDTAKAAARAENIPAGDGRKVLTLRAENISGPTENRQKQPSKTSNRAGARAQGPGTRPAVSVPLPPGTRSLGRSDQTGGGAQTERFEAFRRAYPSRGNASNPWTPARALFDQAVRNGADPQAMIDGAVGYAVALAKTGDAGTKFVAQAKTFIRQRRWEQHQALGKTARERAAAAQAGSSNAPVVNITGNCPAGPADRWRRLVTSIWRADPAWTRSWLSSVVFDGNRVTAPSQLVRQHVDVRIGRYIEEAGFEPVEVAAWLLSDRFKCDS